MSIQFSIAVHGGSGTYTGISAERKEAMKRGIKAALQAGAKILQGGGTSLDAVEAAIVALEDNELFNAGKGAVFASDTQHYLDASIMDGTYY